MALNTKSVMKKKRKSVKIVYGKVWNEETQCWVEVR